MPSPKRRQSLKGLQRLQRRVAAAIMRPLGPNDSMQKTWTEGRPTEDVAAEFIKPNDRLTSFERLEIYNKQYWFRVLDCLDDDFPGLRAILGENKFLKLRVAYLNHFPSRSFSLRNLGSRLVDFLSKEPQWTHPRQAMALDMARFEWAQIEAFDNEQRPALTADHVLGTSPSKLRLALQPYLTLLELKYPLDDFVMALKKHDRARRFETSNAVTVHADGKPTRRPRLPKSQSVLIAVHRHNNDLYYKRLSREQFDLLTALRDGATLQAACQATLPDTQTAEQVSGWFRSWMELGWFCRRE
jgi:hypothetical protein